MYDRIVGIELGVSGDIRWIINGAVVPKTNNIK